MSTGGGSGCSPTNLLRPLSDGRALGLTEDAGDAGERGLIGPTGLILGSVEVGNGGPAGAGEGVRGAEVGVACGGAVFLIGAIVGGS